MKGLVLHQIKGNFIYILLIKTLFQTSKRFQNHSSKTKLRLGTKLKLFIFVNLYPIFLRKKKTN